MSTSSSEQTQRRSWPWLVAAVLAAILVVETLLALGERSYMSDQVLIYGEKLAWAERGPEAEILVFGDSATVAAFDPAQLARLLPQEVRVQNLALSATGPVGGEMLLRRYLDAHPAPELVVLAYSPLSLADEPAGAFATYPLAHLLGAKELLRVMRDAPSADQLWQWLATRLPSYRHRDAIPSALASVVLDGFPPLLSGVFGLLGVAEGSRDAEWIRWGVTQRAARNRRILAEYRESAGWRYFEAYARPGGRLPADVDFTGYRPFEEVSPREARALERLLGLCADAGVPVLVLPAPLPEGLARVLAADGGAERLAAFWERLRRDHAHLSGPAQGMHPLPHRYFGDPTHANPQGATRYMREVGSEVARFRHSAGR